MYVAHSGKNMMSVRLPHFLHFFLFILDNGVNDLSKAHTDNSGCINLDTIHRPCEINELKLVLNASDQIP